MTYEQAKEIFEKFKNFLVGVEWKESYQLAIDAFEKQIPKKPNRANLDGHIVCYCPICDFSQEDESTFCPYCGQALDWSE